MGNYGTILILFILSGIIAIVLHFLASTLGHRTTNPAKSEPFECGNPGRPPFKQRISAKFYLVGLLFILFDMEAVFLFPWAVIYRELGWMGFWSMLTFVAILSVGLVYVWRRGALDWEE